MTDILLKHTQQINNSRNYIQLEIDVQSYA